jgi:hypothetical protein
MTKVKEYVEIEGKRVAVSAQNLIKAYQQIEKLEKELASMGRRNYDITNTAATFLLNITNLT